ncbi:MAG TPA: adenylate/guanylate cyclase domain-containing protein [Bryobacteraceae bacterium]|nr:adenylate/guanylate cyclase domain-containing protein [Bryobacteraceae bacterium]
MSTGAESPAYEMASVLFMDIVSYSLGSIDEQTELLTMLQGIVRETAEYKNASAKGELLSLPTGDGMALVFLRDPVSPAKCALEIAAALKDHAQIKLRMGLHIGPVRRHADIRENMNVVGGGINMAQRVMDCGDAGHILVSQQVADVLQQARGWSDALHELGVQEVKHGVKIHLFNLYKDGLGNQTLPKKLQAAAPVDPKPRSAALKSILGAAAVVGIAVAALALRPSKPEPTPVIPREVAEREFHYYITMQKYRNGKPYEEPSRLSGARLFEKDYRLRLNVATPKPGYLYVVNEGPKSTEEKPDLNALFPNPDRFAGSALIASGQEIEVPASPGFLQLDQEKGTENFWMVLAENPIPEFEILKQWVNKKDHGAVGDPAQARAAIALLKKYGASKLETAEDPAAKMTIVKGKGSVLAYRMQLDHV